MLSASLNKPFPSLNMDDVCVDKSVFLREASLLLGVKASSSIATPVVPSVARQIVANV